MRFALDSDRGVAGFPGDPILSTQRIPRGHGGAILMKMAVFFKENVSRVADYLWGAILMKMTVFLKENVSLIAVF